MWESNRYWTAPAKRERRQDATSRRYGRGYDSSQQVKRSGETRQTRRALVVPAETSVGDATVELRDEPDRIEITAEFADVAPERVGVSLIGTEIRMRARSETGTGDGHEGFERWIALTRSVDVEQADVSRSGSTLTVTLPKRASS